MLLEIALVHLISFVFNNEIHEHYYSTFIDETTVTYKITPKPYQKIVKHYQVKWIVRISSLQNSVFINKLFIATHFILLATPWRGCFQFIEIYISLTYPFLLFLYVHHCAITRWTMICLYVIQGNNCRSVDKHSYFSTSYAIEINMFGIKSTSASCKSDGWYPLGVIYSHSRERWQSPERTASGVVKQGKYFVWSIFNGSPCLSSPGCHARCHDPHWSKFPQNFRLLDDKGVFVHCLTVLNKNRLV